MIELCLLHDMSFKVINTAKNTWSVHEFEKSMMYPTKRIEFKSGGTSQPFNLLMPRKELDDVTYLCGNLSMPSTKNLVKIRYAVLYTHLKVQLRRITSVIMQRLKELNLLL